MPRPPPERLDEATRWHRERIPMTRQQWEALEEKARIHGFFASGIVQAGLLKDLHRAIERASAKGTTLEQFKAEVGPKMIKEWAGTVANPSARLENIFRTNMQRAYAHGRRAQQLEPVVLKVRPYWTLVPVLDQRTSEICQDIARRNVVLPATHVFWKTHVPPLHFQAITGDTLITTSRGRVPAEQVRAGMLALTHRRRWRPVTAVLHKLVRERRVRSLLLASGRRLRVTHEHPVLVLATGAKLEWRQAGDLQIGDVVLQHAHQVMRSPGVVIVDADDAPSLGDEPVVSSPVVRNAVARRVPLPIDLDAQTLGHKGEVEQECAFWVLDNRPTVEQGEQILLRWGELLPVGAGLRSHGTLSDADHVHRVVSSHATLSVRSPDAPGPVVLAAALGDRLRRGDSQYGGVTAAAYRDAVVLAPERQLPVAHAHFALERPDAASLVPVLGLDECCDGGAVGSVEWHGSALISIVEETFNGELCDLSVLDDETYVAGGVLVHNCRTAIRALRLEEAERLGITTRPPKVEPMQGFGGVQEVKADAKGLPLKLAEQVKARNKKPPPPPPKPPVELERPPAPDIPRPESELSREERRRLREERRRQGIAPPPRLPDWMRPPDAPSTQGTSPKGQAPPELPERYRTSPEVLAAIRQSAPRVADAFGDKLYVDSVDSVRALEDLEKLPPGVIRALSRITRALRVSAGTVEETFPSLARAKSLQVSDWSKAAGVYISEQRAVAVARGGSSLASRTTLHELGHAVDFRVDADHLASNSPEFKAVHGRFLRGQAQMTGVSRYFTNERDGRSESYAESFAFVALTRTGYMPRANAVEFWGEELVAYMERVLDALDRE